MFNYCPILKVLNLSSFNTSKVNNMQQMFITCYEIIELNLSNFDMSNLGYCSDGLTYSGKEDMCLLLSRYSGQCRITCTLPTQRALESGTKLGVSVTWVRP